MLGREFRGATPGSFRARSLGVLALASGRPDLLRPPHGFNTTKGYGTVSMTRRGQMTVGDESVQVLPANLVRSTVLINNTTHLNIDGTESPLWAYKNGSWRTPEGSTPESARIVHAFGRPAYAGDFEIDVGKQARNAENQPEALWITATGTTGAVVRYYVSETTKYGTW